MTHKLRWIAAGGGLLAVLAPAPAQAVQFSAPSFVDQLNTPTSFAYGDLNGDGLLDIASSSADGVRVRLNTTPRGSGTTNWAAPVVLNMRAAGRPNVVAVVDLNGDARPDLVTANAVPPGPLGRGPAITVLRNISTGGRLAFAVDEPAEHWDEGPQGADVLLVANLNQDGKQDVVYANSATGRVSALRNISWQSSPARVDFEPSPTRVEDPATAPPVTSRPVDLAVAQINAEGSPELVVGRQGGQLRIHLNTATVGGALGFSDIVATEETEVTPLAGIAAGPIDNGDPLREDVVAVGGTSVTTNGFRVMRNVTTTRDAPDLAAPVTKGGGNVLTDVVVADDVDGAGGFDLVGSRDNGQAVIAANRGNLQFDVTNHRGGSTGAAIFSGEINGDGDNDVSVLDADNDRAAIALQTPEVKTSPGLVEYVEDLPPVVVDPNLTVFAPGDTTELTGATVQVTTGAPGDRLEMPARPDIAASYDAGSRTLRLGGRAPVAAYEQALRSVVFSSPGDDPVGGDRRFAFSVSSHIDSPAVTRDGKVTPLNDVPLVALSGPSAFLDPRAAPVAVDPGIDVRDPDSGSLAKAVFAITSGYDRDVDDLDFPPRPNFRASFSRASGTLEITAVSGASLAEWRNALRTVTFDTRGTSIEARAIEIRLTDSAGLDGPAATRTFAFAPVLRGAPSLSGNAVIGQILTANPGDWFGSAPIGFRYQWQRCDANGNACGDIAGASGQRYFVSPADGGSRLRAIVVADNAAPGESTAVTPPSAVVPTIAVAGARQSSTLKRTALPTRFSVSARALRDGRIRLTIRAPRAGRVAVSRVRVGRSTRLSARSLRIRRAGISSVTLRPTRAARRLVSRRGRVTMRLRVTYRPTRGATVRKTLKVTIKKQRAARRTAR